MGFSPVLIRAARLCWISVGESRQNTPGKDQRNTHIRVGVNQCERVTPFYVRNVLMITKGVINSDIYSRTGSPRNHFDTTGLKTTATTSI